MKPVYKALIGSLVAISAFQAWGAPQGRVSLSQASFVSPDYQNTPKRDFHLMSAGFDTLAGPFAENEIGDSLHGQVRGMVAPGESVLNYLDVSQLFWKQGVVSVGRKKLKWNELDDKFKLGLYQPLFQWNPLQWDAQGLTGIFLHLEADNASLPWGVTFMGSPLFIPNQGASYEIKDGVFEKSNPYFRAPPTQAMVNDDLSDVHYDVQKPAIQDVVSQQSLAARLFVGEAASGPFGQVAFANKPMNDLSLAFKAYQTSDNIVNVEILPAVVHHQTLSADLAYAFKKFRVGVSGVKETPKEAKFEEGWTYSEFKESNLLSPFVEFRFLQAEVQFATLMINGGESMARGPEGHQATKFIPQRYPFRNAQLLVLKYQHKFKRYENIAFSTQYLRGEKGEFDLWTTQASYQWSERWAGNLTSQMVAVDNSQEGRLTSFNNYLNNDVVVLGVTYVF